MLKNESQSFCFIKHMAAIAVLCWEVEKKVTCKRRHSVRFTDKMQIRINNSRCFGRTYALEVGMQHKWAFFREPCVNMAFITAINISDNRVRIFKSIVILDCIWHMFVDLIMCWTSRQNSYSSCFMCTCPFLERGIGVYQVLSVSVLRVRLA